MGRSQIDMYLQRHNRYLVFCFQDAKSSTWLKYQIDEKNIANIFFENIQVFLKEEPNAKCKYTAANGLHYSQQDLEFLIEKLKFNIMLFNKSYDIFQLKQIDKSLLNIAIDAQINTLLNLLHEDFERNMNDLQLKYCKVSRSIEKY